MSSTKFAHNTKQASNRLLSDAQLYRDLADLHASALPSGFLASLGPKVLAELYRAIDTTQGCTLIVEVQKRSF